MSLIVFVPVFDQIMQCAALLAFGSASALDRSTISKFIFLLFRIIRKIFSKSGYFFWFENTRLLCAWCAGTFRSDFWACRVFYNHSKVVRSDVSKAFDEVSAFRRGDAPLTRVCGWASEIGTPGKIIESFKDFVKNWEKLLFSRELDWRLYRDIFEAIVCKVLSEQFQC